MVILKSLDEQILFEIDEGQSLLLGRVPECDMVVDDGSVSSQHARLVLQQDQLRIEDLGSTNGTRLNYSILTGPRYLQDGDTVEFGNVSFTVDGPKLVTPSDATPPSPSLIGLEPIEPSGQVADTTFFPEIPEERLIRPSLPETQESEEDSEETVNHNLPVHLAFYVALGLILLSGLLLITQLWNMPPQ